MKFGLLIVPTQHKDIAKSKIVGVTNTYRRSNESTDADALKIVGMTCSIL